MDGDRKIEITIPADVISDVKAAALDEYRGAEDFRFAGLKARGAAHKELAESLTYDTNDAQVGRQLTEALSELARELAAEVIADAGKSAERESVGEAIDGLDQNEWRAYRGFEIHKYSPNGNFEIWADDDAKAWARRRFKTPAPFTGASATLGVFKFADWADACAWLDVLIDGAEMAPFDEW